MVCNFRLLACFLLDAIQYGSVSFILVNKYKFLLLGTLERYIDIFEYEDEQFSVKKQVLEFYITYTKIIYFNKKACSYIKWRNKTYER